MHELQGKFLLVKVDLGDRIAVLAHIVAFIDLLHFLRPLALVLVGGFLECLPDVASKFLALKHNILAVLLVKTFDSNSDCDITISRVSSHEHIARPVPMALFILILFLQTYLDCIGHLCLSST